MNLNVRNPFRSLPMRPSNGNTNKTPRLHACMHAHTYLLTLDNPGMLFLLLKSDKSGSHSGNGTHLSSPQTEAQQKNAAKIKRRPNIFMLQYYFSLAPQVLRFCTPLFIFRNSNLHWQFEETHNWRDSIGSGTASSVSWPSSSSRSGWG